MIYRYLTCTGKLPDGLVSEVAYDYTPYPAWNYSDPDYAVALAALESEAASDEIDGRLVSWDGLDRFRSHAMRSV
jgi:hypothetical protein